MTEKRKMGDMEHTLSQIPSHPILYSIAPLYNTLSVSRNKKDPDDQ